MIRIKPALLLVPLLTLAACDDDSSVGNSPDGGAASALTFWGDVAPIFADKCLKCHQSGGIAPFRLDTYEDARKMAPAIAVETEAKLMPPFLVAHDGSCGQFDAADTLSDAQIATIKAWAAGEQKEGTKVALTIPKPPALEGGVDFRTPTIAPVAEGGKLAEYDEYRCFLMENPIDRDRFITGYDVVPGNPAIVHHALAFLIDPTLVTTSKKTNLEAIQALDAGENGNDANRVGWPCFGLAGQGVDVKSVPISWAPGQGPVRFPEKMGVPQKKTDLLVIQIHYNLSDPKHRGESDTTTVRFTYADTVERQLVFQLSDGLLETLGKDPPDVIPARTAAAGYVWKKPAVQLGIAMLPYVDLVGIMPHMHQRGRRNKFEIIGGDGTASCQARVDRWDFTWQKFYFYKNPPRLDPKSQIQVSCEYDTSKDEMPVLPGWGTRNEMCLDVMMLALPPGI